ncbi:TetR family transcriptional regulator [Streptomyces sp. NPDC000594]|uniref:TetR/AcrR family transcriptional regulator n=1 Tax=Streptomyces sp. NPDC000594 TaxID=3154261 RepID=UPI0033283327
MTARASAPGGPGTPTPTAGPGSPTRTRADLIADTALELLAERGMRGLTHRAVDEAAGLPQGSASNHCRTRQALLEAAVRRLAEREGALLGLESIPVPAPTPVTAPPHAPDTPGTADGAGRRDGAPAGVPEALLDAFALGLHRCIDGDRTLLIARHELALEATRRPELRAYYDATGARFRTALTGLLRTAGSTDPERHALSLIAWAEGIMFTCAAGSYHAEPPSPAELRTGLTELLRGMLGAPG